MKKNKVPTLLKWLCGIFLSILVPTYWIQYGPANFLWFSDIALFSVCLATFFEWRLLASMAAVGSLILESFWNLTFFLRLFFGVRLTGLTDYMFDSHLPLWLRLLSLFHVFLPILALWLTLRLGYHRMAWKLQALLSVVVITLTWFFTNPLKNVNWVYNYKTITWIKLGAFPYLILESIVVASAIGLTHQFLMFVERQKERLLGPSFLPRAGE